MIEDTERFAVGRALWSKVGKQAKLENLAISSGSQVRGHITTTPSIT